MSSLPTPASDPPIEIPVLRPLLPSSDRLLPYLRRIDATRLYSNFGPLSGELEARLAEHFRLPRGGVACASSGTSALIGAILASAGRAGRERPLALIPAFTFVATAAAAEQCGYVPYLADVHPQNWTLDAETVRAHPMLDRVGLVLPTAPFGRPVPQEPWLRLRAATGVPVVVDGAASFAGLIAEPARFLGNIPVAISFHATKSFCTGEGGAVISEDAALVGRVARALNFGILGVRDCQSASINGKMSEYHAAVGLAELDGWAEKLDAFHAAAHCYRRNAVACGIAERLHAAPDLSPTHVLFCARDAAEMGRIEGALRHKRVDFRFWYGKGLHRQSYYAACGRDRLPITDSLASSLIGLPISADLPAKGIERIVGAIRDAQRPPARDIAPS